MSQIAIKIKKTTLVFDNENQLINGLKPEALEKAIRKGKGYIRSISVEKRQRFRKDVEL